MSRTELAGSSMHRGIGEEYKPNISRSKRLKKQIEYRGPFFPGKVRVHDQVKPNPSTQSYVSGK